MSFRSEVRDWLDANCPASCRGPGEVPGGGTKVSMTDDQRLWIERCAERGFTVPTWPQEYGGGGTRQGRLRRAAAGDARAGHPRTRFGHGHDDDRPDAPRVRHRGAEETPPAADRLRRGLVVPGLLGTRFRLGPRLAADPRREPGRPLRRQRPEDLDLGRLQRGLDLLPRAHGSRCAEARGHQLPAVHHGPARGHGSAHPPDLRGVAVLRDLLRQRHRREGRPRRRAEQGLDRGQAAASARTFGHRHAGQRHQPRVRCRTVRPRAALRRRRRGPDRRMRICATPSPATTSTPSPTV